MGFFGCKFGCGFYLYVDGVMLFVFDFELLCVVLVDVVLFV